MNQVRAINFSMAQLTQIFPYYSQVLSHRGSHWTLECLPCTQVGFDNTSEVFYTMLMEQPAGRRIQQNESPECEQVFGEFLSIFILTLRTLIGLCDTNVFAVHMLAKKYAMKWLRMAC